MPTVTAEHLIETIPAIVPVTSHPRRLPPEKYLSAKKEFEQMVAESIIIFTSLAPNKMDNGGYVVTTGNLML